MVSAEVELVSLQNKNTWHVFEMVVDDDHLKSTDVKMEQVADGAKLIQPLPATPRMVYRFVCVLGSKINFETLQ